jgi:F420-0:gamma-glutamyl ligase
LKTGLVRENDNLLEIIRETIMKVAASNVGLDNGDILAITESILARSQGNYASAEQITADLDSKFSGHHIGVVHPIASRNRFAEILKIISGAFERVTVQLDYPCDEVGNHIISPEVFRKKFPHGHTIPGLSEEGFRAIFGYDTKHPFTGLDYIEYYKSLGDNINIVFCPDPTYILKHTKAVLAADIHSRHQTKKMISDKCPGAVVYGLDDIMTKPVNGSGYNAEYGLLGSNYSTDKRIKLFPRDCQNFVNYVQEMVKMQTGKKIEVMIFGDGAFKDPVGKIWELADPVVSPGFTRGLIGTPAEVKLKAEIDKLSGQGLSASEVSREIEKQVRSKGKVSQMGTTPRQYADLLGSLSDLVTGSGDKGTPLVLVKGYCDNYFLRQHGE